MGIGNGGGSAVLGSHCVGRVSRLEACGVSPQVEHLPSWGMGKGVWGNGEGGNGEGGKLCIPLSFAL